MKYPSNILVSTFSNIDLNKRQKELEEISRQFKVIAINTAEDQDYDSSVASQGVICLLATIGASQNILTEERICFMNTCGMIMSELKESSF